MALNKSMALTAKQYVYKKNLKKPESGFPFTLPDLNVEILPIDRGSFVMGTSKNVINRGIHEQTRKKAKIPYGFWIAKQEVTQEVYEKILLENPSIYIYRRNQSSGGKSQLEKCSGILQTVERKRKQSQTSAERICLPHTDRERMGILLSRGYNI